MNVIYSMRCTITRLFVISVLSLTSHIASAVPLQPGLLFDPQFQTCLDETALANGWTLTEEVTVLKCSSRNIQLIDGLENFTNLLDIDLSDNQIEQVGPLVALPQLQILNLSKNNLFDIFPLQSLLSLSQINLSENTRLDPFTVQQVVQANPGLTHIGVAGISMGDLAWLPPMGPMGEFNLQELDISRTGTFIDLFPLMNYPNLRVIKASGNQLQYVGPLSQLTQLSVLDLSKNLLIDVFDLQFLIQLSQLDLSGNTRLDPIMVQQIVQANPGLTHIGVAGISMGDLAWLPPVGPMGEFNLQELDISRTGTFIDLFPLMNYPNLKVIKASGNQIQYVGPLNNLTQLTVLDLSDNQLMDVFDLQVLTQLSQLNLSGNSRLDPLMVQQIVQSNPGLTHIGVAGISMGDLAWLPPTGFMGEFNLLELDISRTGTFIDLFPLMNYPNLRVIKASGNQLQYVGPLSQLTQLEVVDLSNNQLMDTFDLHLLTGLTQLSLSGNTRLDPFTVQQIVQSNPELTHIGVAGISMGNLAWLPPLGFLGEFNFQELDISRTGTFIDLFPLMSYPNLRVIKASGNKLEYVGPLSQLTQLSVLDLSDNQLTDVFDLQFLTQLTQLNLSGNSRLDPLMVQQIVQSNPGLTHIGVADINMGDLAWLPSMGPMGEFNLQELDISRTGTFIDLFPLINYRNLRVIKASGNQIQYVGPLNQMTQLTVLDLSDNQLMDVFDLQILTQLSQLNLSGNTDLDPLMVQQIVQANPGLTHIGVADINMGDLAWLPPMGPMGEFNLQELDISRTGTFIDLFPLENYRNLRVIKASGNQIQYVGPLFNQLTQLSVLDLSDNQLMDANELQFLTQLSQLNLSENTGLESFMVQQIVQANPGLTHIGVAGISMGDLTWLPAMGPMGEFNLQELDISRTGTLLDLYPLTSYPNLRVIKASGDQIQYVGPLFNQLTQLTVLDLSDNQLMDVFDLQLLTQLSQLNLSGNTRLDPLMVQQIVQSNPELTHIGVADINMGDLIWLPAMGPMGEFNLQELDISRTGTFIDLFPLANYPKLRVIKASGNQIQYVGPLNALTQLSVLDLSDNQLMDVFELQFLTQLSQLNLSGNARLDPPMVEQIVLANPGLTHIGVADISMGHLYWLPPMGPMGEFNLQELDISRIGTLPDLFQLNNYPNLRVVKASGNQLQNVGAFGPTSQLDVLDLSDNQLIDVFELQFLTQLSQLNLSGNTGLDPFIVQQIVLANPGLTHIGVAGINMGNLTWLPTVGPSGEFNLLELDISSTGVILDASILSQYNKLKVLKLSNNSVETIWTFDQLQSLQVLDLSNNHLFDIYSLTMLHNLRELNVSNNVLPDPFAQGIDLLVINQVIDMNPGLTHLGVAGVYIGMLDQLSIFITGISNNIVELDISNTGIGYLNAMAGMSKIRVLKATDNFIQDIYPLPQMLQLKVLDLSNNDLRLALPLADLVNLDLVDLTGNNKIQCTELDELEARFLLLPGELIRPVSCIFFNPPIVSIQSPFNDFIDYQTNAITLAATANDVEDGSLGALIQWSSNLNGPLGSGALIDVFLADGIHVITASVTDSHGNTDTTSVSINVLPNTAPDILIFSVLDGAIFNEGDDVLISADANDLEDGNVSHNLQWSSNIDGFLGFGPTMIARLSAGNHIITATVTDSVGATATQTVSIIINALPQLSLLTPIDTSLHNEGEAILFSAAANDAEDGVLDANVLWSSNIDGMLGAGGQLTRPLSYGGHMITASITDSSGATTTQSIFVDVNALPVVTIQQPLDGILIQQGVDVSLLATASDVEDITGTLGTQIIWSSNIDGVLGTGEQLNPVLSAGSHIITASITDTNGLTATQSITVNVNGQPQLTILSPLNGTLYQQGDSVTLTGTASDLEDGILTTGIEWVSSLQGLLGTGGSLTQMLAVGSHIITAEVRDSTGGITTHTVSINVNGLPLLSARTLSGGSLFNEGDSVTFVGDATDIEDGVITANISWISSLDGVIGTGAQLTKVLSVGNHTITASVTDSAGVTVSESIALSINGLPQLNLLAPLNGGLYQEGDSITFSGSASDAEDGVLDANINWNSNLQGNIGSGAQFSAVLNPGAHLVTVEIMDSTGTMVEKTLTLTVNGLPHLDLLAPLNTTVYPFGSTVSFAASANDLEDGVLDASINWTSNIAGALGTGSNLNVVLGEGVHRITATVTDVAGGSTSQLVSVTVNPNELPQLTLLSPVNASVSQQGDSVILSATASDLEDGVLSASVSWSSSQDGVFGTGAQLTRVLSVGSHVITASVTDSAGATTTQTSSVTVNSQPQVTIQSPLSGSLFMLQESVNLTATANDLEDGIISTNVQWSSNLDGLLGSGAALNTNLTLGTHTLTASVTDSAGGVHSVTTQIVIDQIALSMIVSGNGKMKYAEINWSGSRTAVDIHQEGINVGSYPATGSTVLRFKDQVFIRVCETGTNYCSEPVTYGYTPLN